MYSKREEQDGLHVSHTITLSVQEKFRILACKYCCPRIGRFVGRFQVIT
jgi:hypothetical protein